jgi:hypothetical protein
VDIPRGLGREAGLVSLVLLRTRARHGSSEKSRERETENKTKPNQTKGFKNIKHEKEGNEI